jgi:hypothetical protein
MLRETGEGDADGLSREIRATLDGLQGVALRSTRDLDDTYYSLLEKVGLLRSTIASLQELSNQARDLQEMFQSDTSEVVGDTRAQIANYDEFEAHTKRVTSLSDRIRESRERSMVLGERLERANQKLEEKEKRDNEWKIKARRRVTIFWAVLATVAAIVIPVILYFYLNEGISPPEQGLNCSLDSTAANSTLEQIKTRMPSEVRDVLGSIEASSSSRRNRTHTETVSPTFSANETPELEATLARLMDEL